MTCLPQVLTATMAKLYADQGYLRKAAAIYRQLLEEQPGRGDLAEALARVEEQIALHPHLNRKELELLVREWIDLHQTHTLRKKRGEHALRGDHALRGEHAGRGEHAWRDQRSEKDNS